MRSHRFYCHVIAAGSVLVSVPAMAQDEEFNFDGPYISVFGGIAMPHDNSNDRLVFDRDNNRVFGDTVVTTANVDAFSPGFCGGSFQSNVPGGGCRKDRNLADYGGRIGYDTQRGTLVVGGLFEVSRAESTEITSAFSTTPAAYEVSRELNLALALRARVGVAPTNRVLIYATGGASYARIRHDFRTTNSANAFTEFRDRDMVWGWQAGAGAEFLLTRNISLGAEYLHSSYRDNKYYVGVTQGTAAATNPFLLAGGQTNIRPGRQRLVHNHFRAVLSFRFGQSREMLPPPPPPPPVAEAPPPPPPPPAAPAPSPCNKGPYIVFFDWDRADITAEAASILDSAVNAYGSCERVPVMIAGYADRSGSPGYNQGLSERRAGSVRGYMTSHGMPDAAINMQGFGETNNRVPTADGVRELQNRRVEITYGPGSGM